MEQLEYKIWYFVYLIIGIIITTIFPKTYLIRKFKRFFFKLIYRNITTLNIALLKNKEEEIKLKLAQIAEVLHSTDVSNISLSVLYEKNNILYSTSVYDISLVEIDHPNIPEVKYDSPEIKEAIKWILSPDFPGYLFYEFSNDSLVDNLGSKSFKGTVIFPKILNNNIIFIIHANYTYLDRDFNGITLAPEITEYQMERITNLKSQIYKLIK